MKPAVGLIVALAALIGPGQALAADGVATERSAETGRLNFVGTDPGVTIDRPPGLSASAGARRTALAFADSFARRFGAAGPGSELRVAGVGRNALGRTVRLQQYVDGLPVVGGELVANLDREGELTSLAGEAEPGAPPSSEPEVPAAAAAETALDATARAYGVEASTLSASDPVLAISDARLLGGPGSQRPALVWQLEVTDGGSVGTVREFVLVDAALGNVAVQFSQIDQALNRVVCDAGNAEAKVPCTAPYAREELDGPTGDADVDLAYDYAGDTYDLYASLGRDSLDGAGLTLASTVKYCEGSCPYLNAFWNGSQMVYGPGFSAADDVVGHELTHGVTEFSSHLFYYYESGAINESLSDVFGELIDLTNGEGDDSAGVRWLLGEDIPANFNVCGANTHIVRNMKDPTDCGDPDRTGSANYYFNANTDFSSAYDGGGVHTNSGVNNKAAYLMTDGDTFNGQTVTGLGIGKVKRIYYRVNDSMLTSAADYQNLSAALRQACSDLTGTAGITTADCEEVDDALLATEMDEQPANAPAFSEPPLCEGSGEVPVDAFAEDFEGASLVGSRWTAVTTSGFANWFYPPTANPYSFDATYATSGSGNLWAYDQDATSDTDMRMTVGVTVPDDGLLRFQHANGFDAFAGVAYDGGVLEYSTDGGASWSDAGPMITANGYGGTLTSGTGNPLGGRQAFVGDSAGYRTTMVDLSSLAGQSVRFRFRMGTDAVVADYGWFIDDIRIYACESASEPSPPDTTAPSTRIDKKPAKRVKTKKRKAKVRLRFSGLDDVTPASGLRFQCKVDKGRFKSCASPARFKLKAKKGKGKKHKIRVRAIDAAANVDPTPAKARFRVIKKKKKRRR